MTPEVLIDKIHNEESWQAGRTAVFMIQSWIEDDDLESIDRTLLLLDPHQLDGTVYVTVLHETAPVAGRLKYRELFRWRCEKAGSQRYGEERTESMLKGL